MTAPLLKFYNVLRFSEVRMRLKTDPLLKLYRVLKFSEVRLRLMTAPLLELYSAKLSRPTSKLGGKK
jgi:hypothetical protein